MVYRYGRLAAVALLMSVAACDCEDEGAMTPGDGDQGAPQEMGTARDLGGDQSSGPVDAARDLDPSGEDLAGDQGLPPADASMDQGPPTYEAFCAGEGSVGYVDGPMGTVCGGDLAQTTFRFAMCSCSDFVTSGAFTVDAFDSRDGLYMPGGPSQGGSVGINGRYNTSSATQVGGSLWVGDAIVSSQDVSVGLDLNCLGNVNCAELEVAHDARIGGNAQVQRAVVGRDLTQPADKTFNAQNGLQVDGTQMSAPVSFEEPCDCREELLVDVNAFIAAAKGFSDNDIVGVAADAFVNLTAPTEQRFACGRYSLDGITGGGGLKLVLEGRTAIYIDGDISISGLEIVLEPGATLDLFVSGQVNIAGGFTLGDLTRPAATRLYVGGTQNVNISGGATVAANIYAPRAQVVVAGGTEIFGAVFAQRVNTAGDVTIHHDVAILAASEECGMSPNPMPGEDMGGMTPADMGQPPAQTCDTCRACGNQACGADGECGPCQSHGDCCAPLLCLEGTCVYYDG